MTLKVIARIRSPFCGKFGVPRQSGRVPEVVSRIVFEPEYRNADALRSLDGYSHLWILWQFSEAVTDGWSPTVRPPRLGGNQRVGVFASRSPYRPNPIGLSCVKIAKIVTSSSEGPYLEVFGADLLDGTPIYDLKPYLPTADCIPDATGGFAAPVDGHTLKILDPDGVFSGIPHEDAKVIRAILAEDPRPAYQQDPERIYSFEFDKYHIAFRVDGVLGIVCGIDRLK